jgi:hypothetical protein
MNMAAYLYLFRGGNESGTESVETQARMKRWVAWIRENSRDGQIQGGEPLELGGRVVRGNRKSVSDGPYAEAKDLVGGYLVVTARDLDSATELAKTCPIFERENGSVEVRQLMEMDRDEG